MVVDDEATITMQLEERLVAMGYDVAGTASSGEEAIEMARCLRPDIILMDIMMPEGEMDGINAAEKIIAEMDIPVIFLTACADDKTIKRAKRVEPFGYIIKPFENMEVRSNIEIALQKHKTEKALHASYHFLEIANEQSVLLPLLKKYIIDIKKYSGCIAAGIILLNEEGKISYQHQQGFNTELYKSESPYSLKANPYLYADVINQKVDSQLPYRTKEGSFLINHASSFLETVPKEMKKQASNLCTQFGYESVAFIPIQCEKQILGLIHVADMQKNMLSSVNIDIVEKAGKQLGNAINRIKAVETITANQESFDNIVEKNNDCIIVTNSQGVICFVNSAAQILFNRTRKELVGELFGFPIIKNGSAEIDLVLKNGTHRTGDMQVVDTLWNDKHAHLITIRDITDRKEAEQALLDLNQRLKELDQLKSDFISTVSHELRTPLAIIREAVALSLDGAGGDLTTTLTKYLTSARNNIDRLARLVTDLLDISKIEQGKLKLRRSVVNLNDTVQKICSEYLPEVQKKGVTLEFKDSDSLEILRLYADEDKIIQIFNNLLSNALHHTIADDKITIEVQDSEGFTKCSVSDTGSGITNENIIKLFIKFQQIGRVDGPGYKGTGLGLAITKGLVEKHGGEIWVESELGKGSTFYFTIKKHPFPKILIVDDEEKIINVVKELLSVDNYRFVEAYDGETAIQKLITEDISLVILDLKLPRMSGNEVIGRLKQNKHTHTIPILIMSGFPVDEEKIEQMNSEAVIPILRKPFKSDELRREVSELLKN